MASLPSSAQGASKAAARRPRPAPIRDQRGAIAVLVAVMMVVFIGMAAMAIDFGHWWQVQRHLQTQADAGALAGADQLLQNPASCPGSIQTVADQYAAPNSTTTGSDAVPPGVVQANGIGGKVTATTTVACPGAGSYVDVTMSNYNPGASFFSGINPTVGAHARVSLLQVGSAGGSQVLPYAITQSAAANCCNTLVRIQVNASGSMASQSLVCDGTKTSGRTTNGALMQGFELNGCPTTQVSASPTTCQTTTPASCLAEFNGVDEASYDVGLMRFNNNVTFGGVGLGPRGTCPNANGKPVATDYNYQLPTLNQNDPRLVTIFVVPDQVNGAASFQYSSNNNVQMIPIIGYASFYLAGWDHDPCETAGNPSCPTLPTAPAPPPGTKCDPIVPGASGPGTNADTGTVWGYYVKNVMPASSGATGTIACNPNSNAASDSCVAQMTQ